MYDVIINMACELCCFVCCATDQALGMVQGNA